MSGRRFDRASFAAAPPAPKRLWPPFAAGRSTPHRPVRMSVKSLSAFLSGTSDRSTSAAVMTSASASSSSRTTPRSLPQSSPTTPSSLVLASAQSLGAAASLSSAISATSPLDDGGGAGGNGGGDSRPNGDGGGGDERGPPTKTRSFSAPSVAPLSFSTPPPPAPPPSLSLPSRARSILTPQRHFAPHANDSVASTDPGATRPTSALALLKSNSQQGQTVPVATLSPTDSALFVVALSAVSTSAPILAPARQAPPPTASMLPATPRYRGPASPTDAADQKRAVAAGMFLFAETDIGRRLADRFAIRRLLGAGTSSVVVECTDTVGGDGNGDGAPCAVKILSRALDEAQVEVEIDNHRRVARVPTLAARLSRCFGRFTHAGHACLVFDLLGPTLATVIGCWVVGGGGGGGEVRGGGGGGSSKDGGELKTLTASASAANGLPHSELRPIVRSLLRILAELAATRPHATIHGDLKPQNVACRLDTRSGRVNTRSYVALDLGLMHTVDHADAKIEVQTPSYRAPEVFLRHRDRYGPAIDMWSVGCMLAEARSGRVAPLFVCRSVADQLRAFCDLLGPPPLRFLRECANARRYYPLDDGGGGGDDADSAASTLCVPNGWTVDRAGAVRDPHLSVVRDAVTTKTRSRSSADNSGDGTESDIIGDSGSRRSDDVALDDLVRRMLCYDPRERITPDVALSHVYFLPSPPPQSAPLTNDDNGGGFTVPA